MLENIYTRIVIPETECDLTVTGDASTDTTMIAIDATIAHLQHLAGRISSDEYIEIITALQPRFTEAATHLVAACRPLLETVPGL